MTDWEPEVRPVPAELTDTFDHAVFTPEPSQSERMSGVPLFDRLDTVMRDRLLEFGNRIL